jgi:hypothetical protein
MRIQLEPPRHETYLTALRNERHAEDKRLTKLKTRLQKTLENQQPTLFAMQPDGQVNAT